MVSAALVLLAIITILNISYPPIAKANVPSDLVLAAIATVQTAFDTIMADAGVKFIEARTGLFSVNEFSALPKDNLGNALRAGNPPKDVYLTNYLRNQPTTYFYCWDTDGLIETDPSWDNTHTC